MRLWSRPSGKPQTPRWLLPVLGMTLLLPGCGLLKPEVRYVQSTVVAECPKPAPLNLPPPPPAGFFLERYETLLKALESDSTLPRN